MPIIVIIAWWIIGGKSEKCTLEEEEKCSPFNHKLAYFSEQNVAYVHIKITIVQ